MKKGRILVVDDEEEIRRVVGRALASRDYAVETAANGEEALAAVRTFDPDLVVLDLNMPVMDGLTFSRELRTWSQVPVLVLSVREDEADKVAALDLGADDYLTKPFGVDELLARVRALLRRVGAQGAPPALRFAAGDVEIDLDIHRVVARSQRSPHDPTDLLLVVDDEDPALLHRGPLPSGREKAKVAPSPGVSSIHTWPSMRDRNPLTMARPSPVPRRGCRSVTR